MENMAHMLQLELDVANSIIKAYEASAKRDGKDSTRSTEPLDTLEVEGACDMSYKREVEALRVENKSLVHTLSEADKHLARLSTALAAADKREER